MDVRSLHPALYTRAKKAHNAISQACDCCMRQKDEVSLYGAYAKHMWLLQVTMSAKVPVPPT
eukprot:3958613-Amphidinium_carterae.1